MGEGRKDRRSGKRQRSSGSFNKSSSDPELAQAKGKGRRVKDKERWPFTEGLTVDELARYRRRRVQGHPKDSLAPHPDLEQPDEEAEEQRAATARAISSEDLLKENIWPGKSKHQEDFIAFEVELPYRRKGPSSSFALVDGDRTMETETESSRFIAHANPVGRPPLIRRGTSLKREGNFYSDTEHFSAYVAYEGLHRPELVRRPTSLRMEGELETMTEKCEKFIKWLNVSRPELVRLPTNLKLEGDLETATENHDNYVPFVGARRPELLRQNTHLKLEGESSFLPEYADVFKVHSLGEKLVSRRAEANPKSGSNIFGPSEKSMPNVSADIRDKEIQLMEELARDIEEEERIKKEEEEEEERKREEEMRLLVSKLEDLKGPPLEVPEYRDAYKDFPRERPKFLRPEDEIGRADGSKVSSPTHSRFSTKIDQDPEYRSKYLEYPAERLYRKPPLAMRTTVPSSKRGSFAFGSPLHQDSRYFDYEPTSEVKSQYVPHGHIARVESIKMPTNLRLEAGNYDLQPETETSYRTAYCSSQAHEPHYEGRVNRRRERSKERGSPSASKINENYWISKNNGENFGSVNAGQDQDAFQVLSTRVHEENIVAKPPCGSRRGSKQQVHAQAQPDIGPRTALRNRSPSPTYRLHVYNVDDKPQGFGRRRQSPSRQSSGRIKSPTLERPMPEHVCRPYSPSFGRNEEHRTSEQSFVVLDKTNDTNAKKHESRRTDNSGGLDALTPLFRGKSKAQTNWMPPWYDTTNTI